MRVRVGQQAPSFRATRVDGGEVTLDALRGGRVWLSLLRYAGCALCHLRLRELAARAPELMGLTALVVLQSPAPRVTRLLPALPPPLVLLCDPGERLYELYGAEASLRAYVDPRNLPRLADAAAQGLGTLAVDGTLTRVPADFLLDERGEIVEAHYGRYVADHLPLERAVRFARGA